MNGKSSRRNTPEVIRQRIRSVILFVTASVGVYSICLFGLQVVNGPRYKQRAHEVSQRIIPIPAQRGEIFDRNYDDPLVTNQPSFAVDIIPAEIMGVGVNETLGRLGELLQVNVEDIRGHLPINMNGVYQPVEILSGVSYSTVAYIAEHMAEFPGIGWHSKPVRDYLANGSISHVLGYVGDITPEELQVLYNHGYDANSTVGKSGVEKQYDSILRGADGKSYRVVDAHGRGVEVQDIEEVPPENGKNIVLTIDRHIQSLAERALGERMGSVVILKPSTGELLALVSFPYYDPNVFSRAAGQAELRRLFLDTRFPFLNRAVQSAYAPASTFKVIMSAANIEEDALPPNQVIDCTGKILFGGREFNDWKPTGHGPLDLAGALAESCDVYFWNLGRKYLGLDRIIEYSKRFGLGEKTGVDLPGEVVGLIPTPEWKERTFHQPWLGGDTMNISIGQGNLLVTPLQMANVVATVVNGGVAYTPHVLKEVRDATTGRVLQETKPTVLRNSGLRPSTFEEVARDMRGVVTTGTANVVITTEAVQVAGKTGTGEVGLKDHFTSWFASYGPYNAKNPDDRVVVVVMVEATNPWEWWAPKAASIIFQGIFAHENYDEAVKSLEPAWYLNPAVLGEADR
ncbi:MAG TPA: penicillin-binding protein 2 [Spirochaetia bacterium]|nr:penicillin-binding protein 2 [Spirochaetia bacterium]